MSDPCILIVELDLLVRTPLAEYLRECGYLVLEASSAGDARTLLEDSARRVDIVLAEVKSGDAAGFEHPAKINSKHSGPPTRRSASRPSG
jgi:DNA-binding response OmpR family regulator